MKSLTLKLSLLLSFLLPLSSHASLPGGWFEPDDELVAACSYVKDQQFVGAAVMRLTVMSENEAEKSFAVTPQIGQLFASEMKNGQEKEKFKFEEKHEWNKHVAPLQAPAKIQFIKDGDDGGGHWSVTMTAPFKSGDKEKKEVKAFSWGTNPADIHAGQMTIDKTNYVTTCKMNFTVCKESGSELATNGIGRSARNGCHQEGEAPRKRYRGYRAFKTEGNDDKLIAELFVYSYEYQSPRREAMEARLRKFGSEAHGWDLETYMNFLNRLAHVSQTEDPESRAQGLAKLKEVLAKAIAGE